MSFLSLLGFIRFQISPNFLSGEAEPYGYVAEKKNGTSLLPELLHNNPEFNKRFKDDTIQRPIETLRYCNVLPPPLCNNLSTLWKDTSDLITQRQQQRPPIQQCDNDKLVRLYRPCKYAWISHLPKNPRLTKHVNRVLKSILVRNEGWEATDDHSKVGFSATRSNASFVLELSNVQKEIKALNFMIMTSYGDRWRNSTIEVKSFVLRSSSSSSSSSVVDAQDTKNTEEATVLLPAGSKLMIGSHEKHTSEIFAHKLILGGTGGGRGGGEDLYVKKGDGLKIEIRLVGDDFQDYGYDVL